MVWGEPFQVEGAGSWRRTQGGARAYPAAGGSARLGGQAAAPAKLAQGLAAYSFGSSGGTLLERDGRSKALGGVDAALSSVQKLQTLMAHMVSEEDFARMGRDGFSLEDMDAAEGFTIVDSIKAQLALAKVEVAGYTDKLDLEKLEGEIGGMGLAQAVRHNLQEADLPSGDREAGEVIRAVEMAVGLTKPGDGQYAHMVKEGMQPTIEAFYTASFVGAQGHKEAVPAYYAQEIQGYYGKNAPVYQPVDQALLEGRLEQWGLDGAQKDVAAWMVEWGLPLEKSGLERSEQVLSVQFPIRGSVALRAAVAALLEGKRPVEGDLAAAQRQESPAGARAFLDGEALERRDLYLHSLELWRQLPQRPAVALVEALDTEWTLAGMEARGSRAAEEYQRAGRSYEALMTRPDGSYGDSLAKAFAHVDPLLESLGLPVEAVYQKAVRILVYGHREITKERVEQTARAYSQWQSVMDKLSPAGLWSLIREGSNPLTMSLEQLEQHLDREQELKGLDLRAYGEFLRQLDKKADISKEQRDLYVGLYRLLHGISKEDFRALGRLLALGREQNLGQALKLRGRRDITGLDLRLGEDMPLTQTARQAQDSLESQLRPWLGQDASAGEMAAEAQALLEAAVEDVREEDAREQWQLWRSRAADMEADKSALDMLDRAGQSYSWSHLEAARALQAYGYGFFGNLIPENKGDREILESMEDAEAFENLAGEKLGLWEQRALQAAWQEGNSHAQVELWRHTLYRIRLARDLQKHREYHLPLEMEGERLDMRLRLDGSGQSGLRLGLYFADGMEIFARFVWDGDRVLGEMGANGREALKVLEKSADIVLGYGGLPMEWGQGHMALEQGWWPLREAEAASGEEAPGPAYWYGLAKAIVESALGQRRAASTEGAERE